jgi:hypothetical protein
METIPIHTCEPCGKESIDIAKDVCRCNFCKECCKNSCRQCLTCDEYGHVCELCDECDSCCNGECQEEELIEELDTLEREEGLWDM